MLLKYFNSFIKTNDSKPKLKRKKTPFPKQTFIDIDEGTIDQVEIINNNVVYEYLPKSSICHDYKKE